MSAATTSTFPTCKETKMLTRASCLRELNAGTEKQPCCGNINSLQEGWLYIDPSPHQEAS